MPEKKSYIIKLFMGFDIIENNEEIIIEKINNKILFSFKEMTSYDSPKNIYFIGLIASYYPDYILASFSFFYYIIKFMKENEVKKMTDLAVKNSIEIKNLKDSFSTIKIDLMTQIDSLKNENKILKKGNSKNKKNEIKLLEMEKKIKK
jgi:hypothetical protein